MKSRILYILLVACWLLFSCQNIHKRNRGEGEEERNLTKLERLLLLPQDSGPTLQ